MKSLPVSRKIFLVHCLVATLMAVGAESTTPVLHWAMEEGSGLQTKEEVSGVTNIATLINGPTWAEGMAPESTASVNFQDTNPNSYLDAGTLDTNSAYVANTTNLNGKVLSPPWTITAWVQSDISIDSDQCIITSDTDGGQNWWLFYIRRYANLPNNLGFDFGNSRIYSGIDVPAGKPVFVAISSTSTNSQFSVWDGETWTYKEQNNNSDIRLDGLEIGSFGDGNREFQGDLDEIRIYDSALTEPELLSLVLANDIGGDLGGTVDFLEDSYSATNLDFNIQFTEDVQLFDASDLLITGTLSNMTPVISGSGSSYTASIPISGEGTFTVDLIPGTGIQTPAGDPLVLHLPGTATVDFTPPYVVSLQIDLETKRSATITFSEAVQNFTSADVIVTALTNLSYVDMNRLSSTNDTVFQGSVSWKVLDGETNGAYTITVDLSSDVTDLYDNALSTPNPTSTVQVVASAYQLWAIDAGLVAGSNFYFSADPDGDGKITGQEFLHDGDPLVPFDAIKQAFHVAAVNGTNYAVLTIAAPDDATYQWDGDFYVDYCSPGTSICIFEVVNLSTNLSQFTGEFVPLEDASISSPAGMPPLSAGFSYRHFRFTTPIDELPVGFFKLDIFY